MSELTVTVVRLGLLALLWAFVFSIVGVLRGDLFGTKVSQRALPRRSRPEAAVVSARPARNTPTHIAVTEGTLTGTTISLGQQSILIGRNPDATLVLSDDFCSARHARIYPENGDWYAEDLGSTNGTFSGHERLSRPQLLDVGSTLQIGSTVLELRR
jgi:hypothetical protein